MDANSLIYVAKPAVLVKFGDQKADFQSGCSVVDVTFPNTFFVEVSEIHFKNYYTSWLTLKAKLKSSPGSASDKYKTCVKRFQMMPYAHADECTEDYFTLNSKHFLFPLHNITALRFVLHQSSPIWKDFKIDDMHFHKSSPESIPDMVLPKWVTSENTTAAAHDGDVEKTLKQVPSIGAVSKSLQQMWALTNEANDNQSTSRIGRSDIDGCYEISLLSYT